MTTPVYPGAAPPAPPPVGRVKPSGWWYLLPALVFIAGLVVAGAIAIGGLVNVSGTVDDFARFVVRSGQADAQIEVSQGGTYTLYYESVSSVDGTSYNTSSAIPSQLTVQVTGPGDAGQPVPVSDERGSFSFSFSGHVGQSFASVDLPQAGRYRVVVTSNETDPFVVAMGQSVVGRLVRYLLVGLAVALLGLVVALVALIVIARKRGKRKRERDAALVAAGYGGPPAPPTAPVPGAPSPWAPVSAPAPMPQGAPTAPNLPPPGGAAVPPGPQPTPPAWGPPGSATPPPPPPPPSA